MPPGRQSPKLFAVTDAIHQSYGSLGKCPASADKRRQMGWRVTPRSGSIKNILVVNRRLIAIILDHVQERCKWQGPLIYIRYQGSSNASGLRCPRRERSDPNQARTKGYAPSPGVEVGYQKLQLDGGLSEQRRNK